ELLVTYITFEFLPTKKVEFHASCRRKPGLAQFRCSLFNKGILRPTPEFQTRIKCEILVPEHIVRPVVDEILKVINRGSVPEGKIFVYEVVEAYDIRTKESGEVAL